jgi:hypothetical protein
LIVPEPVLLHVNEGWVAIAALNWSYAVALNCCVACDAMCPVSGVTLMVVNV